MLRLLLDALKFGQSAKNSKQGTEQKYMVKAVGNCYNKKRYFDFLFLTAFKKGKCMSTNRKTKELRRMKNFEDLTYSDNFLFGEVMMDEKTCKNVLEIILGIEIAKVEILEKEKHLDNLPDFRSIRMDIYAKGNDRTVYNVEMQVEDKTDTPKRSRYYQSILDSKILPTGSINYNVLNQTFVIFICHYDPFGVDKCYYTFEERCLEDLTISLGDGARKIFLNTQGTNRDEISPVLREFLDYVKNPKTTQIKNKKIKDLDNRVKQVKIDAEVRLRYMTLKNWIDEICYEEKKRARDEGERLGRTAGREEGRKEGEIVGKIEIIRKKYAKGYDVEIVADQMEQEKKFISAIYELLQAYPECNDEEITSMYLKKREDIEKL